jgi:hypothetical protein
MGAELLFCKMKREVRGVATWMFSTLLTCTLKMVTVSHFMLHVFCHSYNPLKFVDALLQVRGRTSKLCCS